MREQLVRRAVTALLVMLTGGAAACPPLPAASQAEVRRAVDAIDDALRAGFREALDRLVAADFWQLLGNGQRVERAAFVGNSTPGAASMYTVSGHRLCGWKDTAVVTYDAVFPAAAAGGAAVSTFIVDVFRNDAQLGWQLAFEQISVRR